MDKYKFHVLIENPKGKKESILHTEGTCPSCGSKSTRYKQVKVPGMEYSRFQYYCNDCYTEWIGNCFKSDYSIVNIWEERMKTVKEVVVTLAVIFVLILVVSGCNKIADAIHENPKPQKKENIQKDEEEIPFNSLEKEFAQNGMF